MFYVNKNVGLKIHYRLKSIRQTLYILSAEPRCDRKYMLRPSGDQMGERSFPGW